MEIWHPWRRLRSLSHVELVIRDLGENLLGHTLFALHQIELTTGMLQVERRCVLTHELIHLERGPAVGDERARRREEGAVDDEAARRLIRLGDLIEQMLWTQDLLELADALWVDQDTLQTRLDGLTVKEHREIEERLYAAERWIA